MADSPRKIEVKADSIGKEIVFESGDLSKATEQIALLAGDTRPELAPLIVPKLELGNVVDSTDSDSDESSQDHSPRLSETGKLLIKLNLEELACQPLTKVLALASGKFKCFVIESCFGLRGNETLRAYPCVLDQCTRTFFVWLGDTVFTSFTKHTFMNLCDLAESHGAASVIFVLDREHSQKTDYRRMFQVVDAARLSKDAMALLVRKEAASSDEEDSDDSDHAGRVSRVHEACAFYKFEL